MLAFSLFFLVNLYPAYEKLNLKTGTSYKQQISFSCSMYLHVQKSCSYTQILIAVINKAEFKVWEIIQFLTTTNLTISLSNKQQQNRRSHSSAFCVPLVPPIQRNILYLSMDIYKMPLIINSFHRNKNLKNTKLKLGRCS